MKKLIKILPCFKLIKFENTISMNNFFPVSLNRIVTFDNTYLSNLKVGSIFTPSKFCFPRPQTFIQPI